MPAGPIIPVAVKTPDIFDICAAADTYESCWRDNLSGVHDAKLELACPQTGGDVLEVACGSGFLTFRVAARIGATGSVMASDISTDMVELLQRRVVQLGHGNVTAVRADAETMHRGRRRGPRTPARVVS